MIIIGQDWYVALDINGNIYSDRMEQFNNIDEFNNALNEIEQLKSKAGETYGKRI